MLKHNKKLAKALKGKKSNSKAYKDTILNHIQEHFTNKDDVHDIAWLMVKQLANKFIKADNTWEGAVAQRFWYLEANKMIKEYVQNIKNCYKNVK